MFKIGDIVKFDNFDDLIPMTENKWFSFELNDIMIVDRVTTLSEYSIVGCSIYNKNLKREKSIAFRCNMLKIHNIKKLRRKKC